MEHINWLGVAILAVGAAAAFASDRIAMRIWKQSKEQVKEGWRSVGIKVGGLAVVILGALIAMRVI